MSQVDVDAVHAALATVSDPEIHRPITDLGMVKSVSVAADGSVDVGIYLTTQGCPLRDRITSDVTAAVSKVPGVTGVRVDLDILLLDLPPGTGDMALSTAALLPTAEVIVVTTPQRAAREVAGRAGSVAVQTRLRIAGVIENMAGLPCPHCGEMVDVFGAGGGQQV